MARSGHLRACPLGEIDGTLRNGQLFRESAESTTVASGREVSDRRTLKRGPSVARVALAHGVNANHAARIYGVEWDGTDGTPGKPVSGPSVEVRSDDRLKRVAQ